MIQNVKLTINGRDFSKRLSTFAHTPEVTYSRTVTTLNGHEHTGGKRVRDILVFSLWPADEKTVLEDYEVLASPYLVVTCTCPTAYSGQLEDIPVRLDSNLSAAFALNSVDGHIYYTGEPIILRAERVRTG